jgi:hypothetical protein
LGTVVAARKIFGAFEFAAAYSSNNEGSKVLGEGRESADPARPHALRHSRTDDSLARSSACALASRARMRLSDFIRKKMDAILVEREAFAATQLPAATHVSPLSLRDHARQILEAVARDITIAQTREARAAKSKGRAPKLLHAPETAPPTTLLLSSPCAHLGALSAAPRTVAKVACRSTMAFNVGREGSSDHALRRLLPGVELALCVAAGGFDPVEYVLSGAAA